MVCGGVIGSAAFDVLWITDVAEYVWVSVVQLGIGVGVGWEGGDGVVHAGSRDGSVSLGTRHLHRCNLGGTGVAGGSLPWGGRSAWSGCCLSSRRAICPCRLYPLGSLAMAGARSILLQYHSEQEQPVGYCTVVLVLDQCRSTRSGRHLAAYPAGDPELRPPPDFHSSPSCLVHFGVLLPPSQGTAFHLLHAAGLVRRVGHRIRRLVARASKIDPAVTCICRPRGWLDSPYLGRHWCIPGCITLELSRGICNAGFTSAG
mmetsp:Transcript_18143/g.37770  ORF Transcript_18143/g.37770 Transcript_18143/m.37770 type:complete len:259 (-) Transcript_18143:571-1347(-)